MKKFFSLVLALVMALSLTTVAWGAEDYNYNTNVPGKALVLTAGAAYDGGNATLQDAALTGSYDAGIVLTGTGAQSVKNVKVVGVTRGIESGYVVDATSITIDNVVVEDCARAIHINTASQANLNVSNSTFEGKISFDIHGGTATFTNCVFNTNGIYEDIIESYDSISFVNCKFAAGYELGFEDFDAATDEMTLTNCTYAGEPVTETNFARLFGLSDADAAMVTEVTNDNNAALYDLYEGDDDLYLDGALRTKVAAKKLTKTQAGQVAGWDIEGTLYVEITKAEATKADFYLTKHGKDTAILYLREAENHGVYTLTGKADKNFVDPDEDPFCGQWNLDPVTDKLYVDDKDGDFYVAGTDAYMLVGGTVVGVELADMDLMVPHQMEGVYDAKDKLVGVKCVVCGATGKVYESVAKVPFGADYDFFDGLPYVLNKVAVKPSTDTDKVTSAETFDAGIAMYVGMSVMAAAGSAVVLKKKD